MFEDIKKMLQQIDAEGEIKQRNPMVALALSICPGLGQHYAGHLLRGITAYILLIIASWLAAIAFMFVQSRISMVFLAVPFVGVALIALDAYRCAKRQPADYKKHWFNRGWIYAGVFLTLLVTVNPLMDLIAGRHIVRAYFITSPGMHPTILTNDIILVNHLVFPKKHDIALIELGEAESEAQLANTEGSQFFARIIGGPGDTVAINKEGVFINGKLLEEEYASFEEPTTPGAVYDETSHFGPAQVPNDAYFVLADNRTYGFDSRIFGFISKDKIHGKVTKVFWSWNMDDGGFKWSRTAASLK